MREISYRTPTPRQ